jgi:hypothetical protein
MVNMFNLTQTKNQLINQSERKGPVWLYICLALYLLASGEVSYAASVSLNWDANNESDLVGYKIYQRILPSSDYGTPVFSGMPSNPSAPQTIIPNLAEGRTYGFIATALDSAGNESSPSNEELISIEGSGSGGGGSTNGWQNADNGSVGAWLMAGLTLGSTGLIAGAVSADWVIAGVGDLDGDGKDDIVWRNTTDGAVAVWLMDGLTIGSGAGIGGAPTTWVIAGIGDVDGDGKADLVWRETNTGDVGIWLMNGLSTPTTGVIAGAVPLVWEIQ